MQWPEKTEDDKQILVAVCAVVLLSLLSLHSSQVFICPSALLRTGMEYTDTHSFRSIPLSSKVGIIIWDGRENQENCSTNYKKIYCKQNQKLV